MIPCLPCFRGERLADAYLPSATFPPTMAPLKHLRRSGPPPGWPAAQVSFDVTPGCIDVRATPAESGLDYLHFNGVQVGAGEAKTLEITAFPQ